MTRDTPLLDNSLFSDSASHPVAINKLIKQTLIQQNYQSSPPKNKKRFINLITQCLQKILSGVTDPKERKALTEELIRLFIAGRIDAWLDTSLNSYKKIKDTATTNQQNNHDFPTESFAQSIHRQLYNLSNSNTTIRSSIDESTRTQEIQKNLKQAYKLATEENIQPFTLNVLQNNFIRYFQHLVFALLTRASKVLEGKLVKTTPSQAKSDVTDKTIASTLASLREHARTNTNTSDNVLAFVTQAMPMILKIKYINEQACLSTSSNPEQYSARDITLTEILAKIASTIGVIYGDAVKTKFNIRATQLGDHHTPINTAESFIEYQTRFTNLITPSTTASIEELTNQLLQQATAERENLTTLRAHPKTFGHFFVEHGYADSEGTKLYICIEKFREPILALNKQLENITKQQTSPAKRTANPA